MMERAQIEKHDHLNADFPIKIGIDGKTIRITDMDMLADAIVDSGYGPHRMFSALIRAIGRSPTGKIWFEPVAQGLKKLIKKI